jgi:predicted dehydrogenase
MRLGLLAAARITGPAVIEPARDVDGVDIVAVAARSADRAREYADEWGIPTSYGSYDELVAAPDVDAIYIATPAALHRHWTLAALAAGKHVLCEKPLSANAAEAREMVAAGEAAGLIMMEAFHWRYHPLVAQMAEVLASGRLGTVQRVEGVFDLPDDRIPFGDIRWDLALGGGALMDLGCYPLQWVRWAVGAEPTVVSAVAECPVPGVDGKLVAELSWPSGVTGRIECSMIEPVTSVMTARLDVYGADGRMLVTNPLAPQRGAVLRVETAAGAEEIPVETSTTYYHQLVAFREAVASGVPPLTSGSDSVATMELIDACYRAAGLGARPSLPG